MPTLVCTSAAGSQVGSQNQPSLAHLPFFSRARPVVQINASLHFEPPKINIFHKDCKRNGRDATCLAAFLCFVPIFLAANFQTATIGKPASLGCQPSSKLSVGFVTVLVRSQRLPKTGSKYQAIS